MEPKLYANLLWCLRQGANAEQGTANKTEQDRAVQSKLEPPEQSTTMKPSSRLFPTPPPSPLPPHLVSNYFLGVITG